MMAIRKIRSFEEDFDTPLFCKLAEEIYIKSHECLMDDDREEKLTDYVTESVYPEIIHNVTRKTIRWKFLGNVELPRVVHARCTHVVAKENMFAQITVRFHTKQQLAIYDRFGRLMHGSEIIAKDVLEYVVFEKHIANEYGKWRIHAKIIPDWMPPREPVAMTYKVVEEPVQEKVEEVAVAQTTADGKSTSGGEESKLIPATA